MPQHKFVYQDAFGLRRTMVYDDEKPDAFGVFTEADMTDLAALNRAQGEHESARALTTTLARIPAPIWEIGYHEGWDEADWTKFLNDSANADMRVWRGRL